MKELVDDLVNTYAKLSLHSANEAETRKKLIDRVLEQVLGWTDDDISYEERVSEDGSTTFADYIIRTADTNAKLCIRTPVNAIPERLSTNLTY
ncbi:MAG: hypothetical protein HLX50_13855 [Alteromonadaceae bacterium]|nr:hypothetical protein [Alteromonadaceae bacterium]